MAALRQAMVSGVTDGQSNLDPPADTIRSWLGSLCATFEERDSRPIRKPTYGTFHVFAIGA